MTHSPPPILVLGLGNELLTDDAVGIRVAEKLQGTFPPEVEVRGTPVFGLALLDDLAGRTRALLIDSYLPEDFSSAQIREFNLDAFNEPSAPCPHFFGLAEIRAVMDGLGLSFPREVRVLAIPVTDPLTFSTKMSPEVAALVDAAVSVARRIVESWLRLPIATHSV